MRFQLSSTRYLSSFQIEIDETVQLKVMVIMVVDKIPNDFKNQSASNANVKDIFLME
jgi:hypothetical protein